MSADHPIHPATVHFPIAFLSLAYGLDILHGVTTYVRPSFLTETLTSSLPDIARAAHYLQALGLIFAIPAVITGGNQLRLMIARGGMYEADGKTLREKVKTTFQHAAMNDVVLAASAYSWWVRRADPGMEPGLMAYLMGAALMPALFASANLGGQLVYNYGVGLNIGSKGKKTQ